MSKITLKPGDYVRTEGMTEEQYHAVAKAFMDAGCWKPRFKSWLGSELIGWDKRDNEFIGRGDLIYVRCEELTGRELTIAQILGTEPDADGWIEWHGGECPVEKGDVIDVRFRDEDEHCELEVYGHRLSSEHWEHEEDPGDIIAYRIHQPEQEEAPMTIEQLLTKANKHAAKAQEHRDKAANHERKADEHEAKRVELVEQARQLMPGYTLEISADWERDVEEQPTEDMADPSNWKAGDVVECVSEHAGVGLSEGGRYKLREECRPYPNGPRASVEADDNGKKNGHDARYFRWISRPQ